MNFKNLIMWAIIVLLSVGLFNMFQDPTKINSDKKNLPFSNFLNEVEAGRVVEVQIQGNNISGVLSDGKTFNTYSPNYPELVDKLSEKDVSIIATPIEDKMPSLLGILLSWRKNSKRSFINWTSRNWKNFISQSYSWRSERTFLFYFRI